MSYGWVLTIVNILFSFLEGGDVIKFRFKKFSHEVDLRGRDAEQGTGRLKKRILRRPYFERAKLPRILRYCRVLPVGNISHVHHILILNGSLII